MKKFFEAKIIDHTCDEEDKTGFFRLNFIADSEEQVRNYIAKEIIDEDDITRMYYVLDSVYEIKELRDELACVRRIEL